MTSFKAQELFDLQGAIALVTGGGTGIGLMAAKALAANGAKVYITGRRGEVLEKAIKAHSSGLKGSLAAIQGDVTSKDDLVKIASQISEGYLHILVNNAGIVGPTTKIGDKKAEARETEISKAHLASESFQQWDDLFRINTAAVFFSTMTFLPLLEAGTSKPPTNRKNSNWTPSIINITSISGIVKIAQNHYAYNASKAATNSLTMMLSHELRFGSKAHIRVNALAPGLFPSEMTADDNSSKDGVTSEDQVTSHTNPAGRTGTAEEMASGILFLATNSFVTGQILAVDGGFISAVPASR